MPQSIWSRAICYLLQIVGKDYRLGGDALRVKFRDKQEKNRELPSGNRELFLRNTDLAADQGNP